MAVRQGQDEVMAIEGFHAWAGKRAGPVRLAPGIYI